MVRMLGRGTHTTDEPTAFELVGRAIEDGSRLLQQEVSLAKAEMQQSIGAAVRVSVLGMVAVMALFSFLVLGITTVIIAVPAHWIAALAFTCAFLVVAAVAGFVALRQTRKLGFPETTETIKEDVEWAKQQLPSGGAK